MATFIALLRGINVSGHKKVPMAKLRTLCEELGFANVRTYIQSGNVIFSASEKQMELEAKLERAIAECFGFPVDTLVRAAKDWPNLIRQNPFLDACEKEPHLVLLCLSKRPPQKDAVIALRERAKNGERIEFTEGALWLHYAAGIAQSKLSPALIDRLVGSPVTGRNYRTVVKLGELSAFE